MGYEMNKDMLYLMSAMHASEPEGTRIMKKSETEKETGTVEEIYKITEVVSLFDSSAALEDAIEMLLEKGFDRSDISLLATEKTIGAKLGHHYNSVEELEDDARVPRKAFVSSHDVAEGMAALSGGLFYVGAVAGALAIVASGGTLAFVLASAAAGGLGGAGVGVLAAEALGDAHASHLEDQLKKGGLLLWVRLRDPMKQGIVEASLREAGGDHIHTHEIEQTWGEEDIPLHDFQPDPLLKL